MVLLGLGEERRAVPRLAGGGKREQFRGGPGMAV
jgi:hypothetical protein